ncbi:short-chain dehydrogenase [Ktedonospora formicarum]|uniref:Short-chain dehydrogenase n=2 Tax=Ktedonospora formicarum TaxID=2778364 RepID=A0A8J3I8E2_9CHLR|nr:short-chain dehydrogenase [Ktedonospora formicarum]
MEHQRIAVVTGANRGIGREIARQLAMHSLTVVLGVRDLFHGETVARELAATGLSVMAYQLDITHPRQVEQFVEYLTKTVGRLDVLVNNAGILLEPDDDLASKVRMETIKTTFETNLFGVWHLTQALLPLMRQQNYGRIVNVSSGIAAFENNAAPPELAPAYRVSKAALNALTVTLAGELQGTNILVNAVCPGYVRTETHNLDALRTVVEGADTPVWLATLPDDGPTGSFFRDRQRIAW